MVRINNDHLNSLKEEDHFHHLGFISSESNVKQFKDVKFVCMSGSVTRIGNFAKFINQHLKYFAKDDEIQDLCESDRYVMYKVGPVLAASHGMGVPSLSILLNELFKLLYYAQAKDVVFFRLGTSGGLGLEPGSVVISNGTVNGLLKPIFRQIVLGELKEFDATLDATFTNELLQISQDMKNDFPVVSGTTMCTDDFYEGQGRLDGAFCSYSEKDKMDYLQKAYNIGVRNIEMESTVFSAMCLKAGVKAGILCVTIVNRLESDQVHITKEEAAEFNIRPWKIVLEYIKKNIENTPQ